MWELDHKESWAPKNWCFWIAVFEKTFESPLNCKEINPVNPKGIQSWTLTGRTDAEAEPLTLWPPFKCQLIGKDPDVGKEWRQEEKGMTEDEMVGCHHWLNGHEFKQAPGDDDGQGSLACCSPWDHKESDVTERLNWTEGHKHLCTQIAAAAVGVGHLFHIQVFSNSKAYYIPTKKWIKTQDVSQRTPRRSVRTGLKKWKANISWYSEHYANASSECPLQ